MKKLRFRTTRDVHTSDQKMARLPLDTVRVGTFSGVGCANKRQRPASAGNLIYVSSVTNDSP